MASPINSSLKDTLPSPPVQVQELAACCLFGNIWGEALALAAIINKTKKDGSFVKGQIFFVEIGNDSILVRFANADDRSMVYSNRAIDKVD